MNFKLLRGYLLMTCCFEVFVINGYVNKTQWAAVCAVARSPSITREGATLISPLTVIAPTIAKIQHLIVVVKQLLLVQ